MRSSKPIKVNTLWMILKDSLSFPIQSTVVRQHEYGGPWMHAVIKETSNSDDNGRSYIVESDEKWQTNNAEHNTCIQHPDNYRAIPLGTDKKGNWMIRGHFNGDNTSQAL